MTTIELAALVKLAHDCEGAIARGEFPEPVAYHAIPYEDQRAERLSASLKSLRETWAQISV